MLAEIGYESVEVTRYSGDGGIDVRCTLVVEDVVRIIVAVQVKKWILRNNQSPIVNQVRGNLCAHEQRLVIANSEFSKSVGGESAHADKTPIAFMDGEQCV